VRRPALITQQPGVEPGVASVKADANPCAVHIRTDGCQLAGGGGVLFVNQ
jgi:hypothetical protein